MDRKEKAHELFRSGFNCSQAVLSVFADELEMDIDVALKISTGFGGGFRRADKCGAVSGAIMAIGLKHGHCIEGDAASKSTAYEMTTAVQEKFEAQFGSTICRELLGYDLSCDADRAVIEANDLFATRCPLFIKGAVEVLEELLAD